MATIRSFTYSDQDYEALSDHVNVIWPESLRSPARLRQSDDTRDKRCTHQRYFIELDGRPVGLASFGHKAWTFDPHTLHLNVSVLPEFRGRGLGSLGLQHLEQESQSLEPKKFTSWTLESQTEAVQFLTRRGFEATMRWPRSELVLDTFDDARFEHLPLRLAKQGITIETYEQLNASVPDAARKLWHLTTAIDRDVPTPEPITETPFEQYTKRLDDPDFNPDGTFIARDGEAWVGVTMLWTCSGDATKLGQGLTGTLRTHRRKGIATALKLRTVAYGRARGVTRIETDNEENNPMYALNQRLGFVPLPAGLGFARKVCPAGSTTK